MNVLTAEHGYTCALSVFMVTCPGASDGISEELLAALALPHFDVSDGH